MLPKPNDRIAHGFKLPRNDCFLNAAGVSPEAMRSEQYAAMGQLGAALASARTKDLRQATDYALSKGLEPGRFCYRGEKGQWFTPLLALMARRTKNQMDRAMALLAEGPAPATPWRPHQERCWVPQVPGMKHPWHELGFAHAAPLLMAAWAQEQSRVEYQQAKEFQGLLERFFPAIDRWPGIDWNEAADVDHTPLGYLALRAPLHLLAVAWPFLRDRGADPAMPTLGDCSALDLLSERLAQAAPDEVAHAGRALAAQWESCRLERALPQGLATRPAGARM